MFIPPTRYVCFAKLVRHFYMYPVYKCQISLKVIKNKRCIHLKTTITILFLVDIFG